MTIGLTSSTFCFIRLLGKVVQLYNHVFRNSSGLHKIHSYGTILEGQLRHVNAESVLFAELGGIDRPRVNTMRIFKTLVSATQQLFDGEFIVKKYYKIKILSHESNVVNKIKSGASGERVKVIDLPESFNRVLAVSGAREFYLIQFEDEFRTILNPAEFLQDEIKHHLKFNRRKFAKYINQFLPYRYNEVTVEKIAKLYSVLCVFDKYIRLTSNYSLVLSSFHKSDLSIGIDIYSIEDLFYLIYYFRKYGLLITQNTDLESITSS